MKKFKLNLLISFLFVFLMSLNLKAQLSGNYIIGSGGDFSSISKAVDSLNSAGRSGQVTFNILDGTYKEQFTIQNHSGMSSSSPVVFKPKSGNSGAVKITFESTSSANNFIVKLENVSYITFQNITFTSAGTNFGTIVLFSGVSNESIIFLNNFFQGVNTTSGSKDYNIIHAENSTTFQTLISGNTFVDGSKAIYLKGGVLLIISNNTISGSASDAVYLENQKAPVVSENNINHTGLFYAVHLKNCTEDLNVIRNKINISSKSRVGIYMELCDGLAQEQSRGLIANNFITVGHFDGGRSGIQITNSTKQDIYYNSINVTNPNPASQAFYLTNGTSEDINIINNNFSNTGHSFQTNLAGGRAIRIDDPNAVFNNG